MKRALPAFVALFYRAFENHAKKLVAEDEGDRNRDISNRVTELIENPWGNNLSQATETNQTTFLRDFFNCFKEMIDSCEHLNLTEEIAHKSCSSSYSKDGAETLKYWNEAYLNDVYICWERIKVFLTKTERFYSKDPDFSEAIKQICPEARGEAFKLLEPFIKVRGGHVHEARSNNTDPEIIKLSMLSLYYEEMGRKDLEQDLIESYASSLEWFNGQINLCIEMVWEIVDSICSVLSEGLITTNEWVIVPTNYKDR